MNSFLTTKKSNILIFGECISRDMFNFDKEERYTVSEYFARSSLVSLMCSQPINGRSFDALTSKFQQRIVSYDFEKTFLSTHKSVLEASDIILLDLQMERLDLFQFNDGAIVTLSNELKNSGFNPKNENGRIIAAKSDEHFDLWRKAFSKFVNLLDETNHINKLVVNKIHWATLDDTQTNVFDRVEQKKIDQHNFWFDKLYEEVETQLSNKVNFLESPEHLVRCATKHRWGFAVYHFVDGYYEHKLSKLGSYNLNLKSESGTEIKLSQIDAIEKLYKIKKRYFIASIHPRPQTKRLVFVFSGIDKLPSRCAMSYYTLGQVLDATVVHIMDNFGTHGCYFAAINKDTSIQSELNEVIEHVRSDYACDDNDVYFIGSSKGGTSALLAGLNYGKGNIVVWEPAILIGKSFFKSKTNPRVTLDRNALIYTLTGRNNIDDYDWLNTLIIDCLKNNINRFKGKIKCFFGKTDYWPTHVSAMVNCLSETHLTHNNVKYVVTDFEKHNDCIEHLKNYSVKHMFDDEDLYPQLKRKPLLFAKVQLDDIWFTAEHIDYVYEQNTIVANVHLRNKPNAGYEYAFYILKENIIIHKQMYMDYPCFYAENILPGHYKLRVYVRNKATKESKSFEISNLQVL